MNKKKSAAYNGVEERNQIALGYLQLSSDKTFKNLNSQQQISLIKQAIAIGQEAAEAIEQEYGSNDPRKIAALIGLRVLGEEKKKPGQSGSQYRKEKKEIVVFRDYHEKLAKQIHSRELTENLLKYLVAHELFFHLEEDRLGKIYKRFRFNAWKLGPFSKEKSIKGLSTVAAQSFTITLLKLKISPQMFDYLAYILFAKR